MFYEERSLGVRSWSGKTLGNNSVRANKGKYIIYIWETEREMERDAERGCEQNTFTHLFIPTAQMQETLLDQK